MQSQYNSTRFADSSSVAFWCNFRDMNDPLFNLQSFRKLVEQTVLPALMRSRRRLARKLGSGFMFTSYEYLLLSDYGTGNRDFLLLTLLDVDRRPALSAIVYPPWKQLKPFFALCPPTFPQLELNESEGFRAIVVETD